MTTKTKTIEFHTDRYPELTINTDHGTVQFHDGAAYVDDPDQAEAVRQVMAEHGITEGKPKK